MLSTSPVPKNQRLRAVRTAPILKSSAHGVKRSACGPCRLTEVVAAFLAFDPKNGTKPSTPERRLAALRYAHGVAGHQIMRHQAHAEALTHPQSARYVRQDCCHGRRD